MHHNIVARRLFTLVSLLSLLLCATTAAVWVRSYRFLDQWNAPRSRDSVVLDSQRGFIWGMYSSVRDPREVSGYRSQAGNFQAPADDAYDAADRKWRVPGVTVVADTDLGPNDHVVLVFVSDWLIVALFAMLPLTWCATTLRKGAERPKGHCRSCGYDLRATPDRCPECGMRATLVKMESA